MGLNTGYNYTNNVPFHFHYFWNHHHTLINDKKNNKIITKMLALKFGSITIILITVILLTKIITTVIILNVSFVAFLGLAF